MKTHLQEWDDELKQLRIVGRALDGKGPLPDGEQKKSDRSGPAILIGLAAVVTLFGIYLTFHNRPEPTPACNLSEIAPKATAPVQLAKIIAPQKTIRFSKTVPIQPPVTFTTLNPTETTAIKAPPPTEQKADLWKPRNQPISPAKPPEEGTGLTRTLAEIHEEIWPTVKP